MWFDNMFGEVPHDTRPIPHRESGSEALDCEERMPLLERTANYRYDARSTVCGPGLGVVHNTRIHDEDWWRERQARIAAYTEAAERKANND